MKYNMFSMKKPTVVTEKHLNFYLHLLIEGKGALIPSIADNTEKLNNNEDGNGYGYLGGKGGRNTNVKVGHTNKPEIAGVSIPSPISMHMPSIAIKSSSRLATMLFSKKLPSLLCFSDLS